MADAGSTNITSASNLKTVEQLAAKRQELEQLRTLDVRDWSLNRAFYNSNQWVFWNRVSSQVESLPVMDGDKPRWKVRLTNNQVRPGVQHYVAQLTKTKPTISATPDSGSYRDRAAAEMATTLFDWWWTELTLKSKLLSAMTNSCISQGWWKISWDPLAGKSMKVLYDPQGKPVTDNELADAYRTQLQEAAEQQGLDPQALLKQYEKTVYVGDIDVEALPGENVIIDPAPSDYTRATYAICKHSLDVDEIKARYGVDVVPNTSTNNAAVPLFMSRKPEQAPKTVRDVFIGYFRPTPLLPKGRVVVWIEDPNQILKDEAWPYPFNELPLVKFPGIEKPGSSTDEPITTDARPLQKELNRTISQIVQHKDLTIKPQMIAPLGALRQRLTDEPGAVFEYQPIQGLMPEWRPTPSLHGDAFNILGDIQQRLDKLFNRIPTSRDSMPARVDAGYSIELLQEAVADQMSPVIQRLEESLARAGKLMVMLAQEYYKEPRLLKIRGDSGSTQVKKFVNADLAGGFSFRPESGTGLPRSRAGRQQRIIELVQANLMDPHQAMRHLDLADMKGIQAQFAANEDMAYREHEKLIKGEPVNQVAVLDAQQHIQQMMQQPPVDPTSGQPVPPEQMMQQAQQMMMQAQSAPTDYEDWETHLNVHGLFMSSPEFGQLPLDAQKRFNDHWVATFQRIMGAKQAQMQLDPRVAPKVGLNFRATTSAPAATEMLDRVGVHVDPDVLAGPPLDTAVFDMVDKPNSDETANSHVDMMAKAMEMQQAQDAHALAMAKTAHQSTLAQSQAEVGLMQTQQQMSHAEQIHQEKLNQTRQQMLQRQRQSDEMHQVKKKQAAKPRPGGNR